MGQRRRAADSGFVGVSTHSASKRRGKNHLGSSAFRRGRHCSDVQIRCGHVTISEEAPLLTRRQKAPKYNNASITGRLTCSYNVYEKIDLALQLFFVCLLFLWDNCWDLILMLLCSFVFSCKNLTVLECLYFIKCVNFLLLYPRIAVIILMSQLSNFFLWKRSEKREQNTKIVSPATLSHLHLQYRQKK